MLLYFAGYNGFNQFKSCDELTVSDMREWNVKDFVDDTSCCSPKFCSSWSVNVLAVANHLLLSGCLKGTFGQLHKIRMSDEIKAISCNDSFCLVLLNNGSCYKCPYSTLELNELNFVGVDEHTPSELRDETSSNVVIEHIACGETFSVAVTNTNIVYNIPSQIHQFPKHVKVKKVVCGAEHALILTGNGDVYSWGSASRGQLGIGQLDSESLPTLIDGLAGVKIIDISSGLWHSAAVSVFGDLYMWGWNVNGQLGKPVYKNVKVTYDSGRSDVVRHKDVSVFASPEIVDLPRKTDECDSDDGDECCLDDQFFIERVCCGSRHTIIKTKCNTILGCGFNRYGQVGRRVEQNVDHNVVEFVEISHNVTKAFDVECGSWCTVLIVE